MTSKRAREDDTTILESEEPHMVVHLICCHTERLPLTFCIPESKIPPTHRKYLPGASARALLMDASTDHEQDVWWDKLTTDEEEIENFHAELTSSALKEFRVEKNAKLPKNIGWVIMRVH
jgi:hypothetical protein